MVKHAADTTRTVWLVRLYGNLWRYRNEGTPPTPLPLPPQTTKGRLGIRGDLKGIKVEREGAGHLL
jgi:hypothetical protein